MEYVTLIGIVTFYAMSTEEQTTGSPPTKRRKLNEEQTSEENTTEKIDTIRTRGLADEEQIGIKSFVGARDDYFKGIIKLRFEDFLVNEVGLDGNVVRLTTYESINPPTSQASSQSSNNPREAIDQIIDAEESENFWLFIIFIQIILQFIEILLFKIKEIYFRNTRGRKKESNIYI